MITTLSAEQILMRAQGIGASEAAPVLGRSPFAGAAQVYERKVNPKMDDIPPSEDQERGIFLEPALRDWYRHRTGLYVLDSETLPVPGSKRVMASPDGVATLPDGSQRGVEIKCPRYPFHWLEANEDEEDEDTPSRNVNYVVPDYYQIQVLLQAEALDVEQVDVVALLNGGLHILPVKRDRELARKIVRACDAFWDNHVAKQIPPPPDDSQKYSDWLSERFPRNTCADYIDAPEGAQEWVDMYCDAKDTIYEARAIKREARNHLVPMIETASGMLHATGKIHFKNTADKEVVDWEMLARSMNPTAEQITEYTTIKPGTRRFDVRRKKEAK